MNDKIKLLALQAGMVQILEEHAREYGSGTFEITLYTELEKFAELIVAECANIAKHHVMNISTYADAEFVEEQIEKHFGVEL